MRSIALIVTILAVFGCSSSENSSSSVAARANNDGGAPDSGGDGDAGSTSTSTQKSSCTVPQPPSVTSDGSMRGDAEQRGLGTLDNIIGRFLRGDIPTYRGTVQANDNESVLSTASYPPLTDGTIPQGRALAMLAVGASWSGDWYPANPAAEGKTEAALVVHGTGVMAHVVFVQTDADPATTWAGSIQGDATNTYLESSCSACAPNFLTGAPASIAFSLTTTGTYTNPVSNLPVTVHTSTTVNLARIAPCDLSWAELKVLNTTQGPNEFSGDLSLGDFSLTGQQYVAHTQGSFGGASAHTCSTVTPYALDLFVDAADIGSYGVRNFALGTPQTVCAP